MEFDNTNTGLMYRNDNREKETHPEFTGSINIGGTEFWLSGWVKVGKEGSKFAGKKFFSLAFKPKDAPKSVPNKLPLKQKAYDDDDSDSIPF